MEIEDCQVKDHHHVACFHALHKGLTFQIRTLDMDQQGNTQKSSRIGQVRSFRSLLIQVCGRVHPDLFCVVLKAQFFRVPSKDTPAWVWLKIKQEGLRRCWSKFPLTRLPFWYRFFEPQPHEVWVCLTSRSWVRGLGQGRPMPEARFDNHRSLENDSSNQRLTYCLRI